MTVRVVLGKDNPNNQKVKWRCLSAKEGLFEDGVQSFKRSQADIESALAMLTKEIPFNAPWIAPICTIGHHIIHNIPHRTAPNAVVSLRQAHAPLRGPQHLLNLQSPTKPMHTPVLQRQRTKKPLDSFHGGPPLDRGFTLFPQRSSPIAATPYLARTSPQATQQALCSLNCDRLQPSLNILSQPQFCSCRHPLATSSPTCAPRVHCYQHEIYSVRTDLLSK